MGAVPPTPRVLLADDLAGFGDGRLVELMATVVTILTLPRPAPGRLEALAVLTGQGEESRLRHAIRRWESDPGIRCLLVADGNPAEATYPELSPGYLRRLGLRRLDGVHVQDGPGPNTALQAAWVAGQVHGLGLGSLALTVSPYHLPRAYLTVLKALAGRGIRIPLIPEPVPVPPGRPVPETGASAYDLIPGEMLRILRYGEAGWLSTPDETRNYLNWLWAKHPSLLAAT